MTMPQREQLALIGESDTQMHFTSETSCGTP